METDYLGTVRKSTRQARWDRVWMNMAREVSTMATCPRANVGTVIVTSTNRLVGMGYNGAPHGMEHCEDVGCDIDRHGSCSRAIHSEMNAVLFWQRGVYNDPSIKYNLITTLSPCSRCAMAIIQVGISTVLCGTRYREVPGMPSGLTILSDAGIDVKFMGGGEDDVTTLRTPDQIKRWMT